jgi:hypothetical protein
MTFRKDIAVSAEFGELASDFHPTAFGSEEADRLR